MISGVNHITLSVRDVDRSFGFYVETLGAKPLARRSKGVTGAQFADAAARIHASGTTIWQDNRSEGASLYFLELKAMWEYSGSGEDLVRSSSVRHSHRSPARR